MDPWESFEAVMALVPTEVPASELPLYAFGWFVSEVNNGGIHQLFFNTAGDVVPEAISAAETAGAPLMADVLRRAAALLGDSYPRDRTRRQAVLAGLSASEEQRLDELDEEYFAAESAYDLRELLRQLT